MDLARFVSVKNSNLSMVSPVGWGINRLGYKTLERGNLSLFKGFYDVEKLRSLNFWSRFFFHSIDFGKPHKIVQHSTMKYKTIIINYQTVAGS